MLTPLRCATIMADETSPVIITLEELEVVDKVNNFVRREGNTIVVESTMEVSQIAWLRKNNRIILNTAGTGFSWVPKAK